MQRQNELTTTIITNEIEIKKELNALNLTIDKIILPALNALLLKLNCTNYNTKGGAGYIQWDGLVRSIREECCGEHWEKYEYKGIEGIISRNERGRKSRIIPSSGNSATANQNQPPSNKNPKGFKTIELINNSQQGSLFYGFPNQIEDSITDTYILLYYNNSKELRLELSIPSHITKAGRIVSWSKRIIIPPIKLDEVEIYNRQEKEPLIEDEIDIPIKRKNI